MTRAEIFWNAVVHKTKLVGAIKEIHSRDGAQDRDAAFEKLFAGIEAGLAAVDAAKS